MRAFSERKEEIWENYAQLMNYQILAEEVQAVQLVQTIQLQPVQVQPVQTIQVQPVQLMQVQPVHSEGMEAEQQ